MGVCLHHPPLFTRDSLVWGSRAADNGSSASAVSYRLKTDAASLLPVLLKVCFVSLKTGVDKPSANCLTLENGSILDDEPLELSTDNHQARLHVAARGYLIALLHFLGTAGRPFGLANLQISTWRRISREVYISGTSPGIFIISATHRCFKIELIISHLIRI